MKTVAAVYTAQAIVDDVSAAFSARFPDAKLVNIVDGGLIGSIIEDNGVTPPTARRLLNCFHSAVDAGADIIFNTCSSVGDVVPHARCFIPIPIARIDEPMAIEAVKNGEKIAVMATLPTTLQPTIRLVEETARASGKSVSIIDGLAEGAFQALIGGDRDTHDELIRKTAAQVARGADTIVLAQGSMARMQDELQEQTGIRVLSSPESGIEALSAHLGT